MPIRVMLVDDSSLVRGLIARGLEKEADIDVVVTAFDGMMAIRSLGQHDVDVILLDIEMPEMDGLTALPKLRELSPQTHIIMVSTLTQRNAEISLKALQLGAVDYIAKPQADSGENGVADFYRELTSKIRALARTEASASFGVADAALVPIAGPHVNKIHTFTTFEAERLPSRPVAAIAIGASTGGPQALMLLFRQLKPVFPRIPVFITQHMPPTFTTMLARHLSQVGGVPCAEAADAQPVIPGHVYLAPGGYHMGVRQEQDGTPVLLRDQRPPFHFCRPAVDAMLPSLAEMYGHHLLTIILTGMGEDGLESARIAVAKGGTVIAQDRESSVVWGMPRAVVEAGLCRAVLPLQEIAGYIHGAMQVKE